MDRVNILVGGNNSGKTSILQAIQFGCSIAQSLKIIAGTKKINTTDFVRTIEAKELVYNISFIIFSITEQNTYYQYIYSYCLYSQLHK